MKVVIQRVLHAQVQVDQRTVGKIEKGLLLFVGFGKSDTPKQVAKLAQRIVKLRIFPNQHGKMDFSVVDSKGSILVVPQFTLYAELDQNRPYFGEAARPEIAKPLFDLLVREFKQCGIPVVSGEFGAHMQIELANDGPVTILIDI